MKKIFQIFFCLLVSCPSFSTIHLAKIFADHMVLQRDCFIPVWGWAEPGESITVKFNNKTKTTIAGNDGRWLIKLDPGKAGGPYQLKVEGPGSILINDILLGDVWICSGQSNMDFRVTGTVNAKEEIQQASWPMIRHIEIPKQMAGIPQKDLARSASWEPATTANVSHFTAVGYFFAREIYRHTNVPIGLIHASWGGSMVETWISKTAFEGNDEFSQMIRSLPSLPSLLFEKEGITPNSYPTLLYNGMINPLIPYGIKGVIWYQGENNTERAYQYRKSFPLMINDWRQRWQQGNFPFYYVQITSFIPNNASPNGSIWAELRESQSKALSLPNTGMAVTIDIGDAHDVHPKNKQDVGKRLAAIALHKTYKEKIVWCGPVYKKMKVKGNKAFLYFKYRGTGLAAKNTLNELAGFEIATTGESFKKANAKIEGNHIVVYNLEINKPVAVRYGWKDDAGKANLFNKEGLPAAPFRTDNREGVTDKNKYSIIP